MFAGDSLANGERAPSAGNLSGTGTNYLLAVQETHESEQHGSVVRGSDHHYSQVRREKFHGRVVALCHSKAAVVRDQVDHPVCYRGSAGNNLIVFASSIDRIGGTFHDGRSFAPNTIVKLPRNYHHRTYFAGAYDNLSVSIDADLLAERVCDQIRGASVHDLMDATHCVTDPQAVDDFHSAIGDVLRCAIRCEQSSEPVLQLDRAVESLLRVLVSTVAIGQDRHQELPRPSTRSYVVDKAVNYLEQHVCDPISIPDLSAFVGVSTRTLRYSFEEITGVSPSEYLLTTRLGMVRRELLAGSSMKSIYRIAHKYGFCNMSRFAHFYNKSFGELPSDTSVRGDHNRRRASSSRLIHNVVWKALSRESAFDAPPELAEIAVE